MDEITKPSKRFTPTWLCLIGLLLIWYSITLRIVPNVIQQQLLALNITMDQLNDMMVKYQYSLILTLIFAGIIVDLVGSRTTLILAVIAAGCGNYLFNMAHSVNDILVSRIIVGFAHPFILISVLKMGSEWLSKNRLALFIGLVFATLLIAPYLSQPLLQTLSSRFNWTTSNNAIMIVSGLLILGLALTVRQTQPREHLNFKEFFAVLFSRPIWMLGFISCLGWSSNTFLLNWGAAFLTKALSFTPEFAQTTVTYTFLCFALGAVLIGFLAIFIRQYRALLFISYLIAAGTFSTILIMPTLPITQLSILFLLTGFFSSTAIMCYPKAYEYCSSGYAGLGFSLIAIITTAGNTLFAFGISQLADPFIKQDASFSNWQMALIIIPAMLGIGGICALNLPKPIMAK